MGFGSFEELCLKAALPLCSLVGPPSSITGTTGIPTQCYSRSVELANTIIFQGAAAFAHIIALIMTTIMIIHVRSKFTAVGRLHLPQTFYCSGTRDCSHHCIGRKEITTFFYIYMTLTIISLILDAGVVPPGSGAYPYFVAVQNGLASASCMCLLINGFVGFQLYEDGTNLSVWLLRLCSIAMFIVTVAVSLFTFKGLAGVGPTNTVGLFVVLYIFNGIFVVVYVIMQIFLVVNTLQDRWPLFDIGFGVFFFVIGQIILYVFGEMICDNASHYLDGLFFGTVCNLLAVMMVYKVRKFPSNWIGLSALTYNSSGTPLQKRISNSVLARSPTIGRSRNFYRMMTGVRLFTWMVSPSMPVASTSSRYTIAIPPTTRPIKST